ncbi:STAS domain-containing protein [Variovorax sp. J22R133]|uniref:STAS domain-containing protein n=1 Tax=Variovorax brevis TaxID=3053503 RepID=UPI0025762454|nr:STAS domain-containing protein [Variovorax sp. J22R133]MDM0111974.1 STAS domain-containing protein [Variovorax sp. J22R133]
MHTEDDLLLNALKGDEGAIIDAWLAEAKVKDARQRIEAVEILRLLREALASKADSNRLEAPEWAGLRSALSDLSASRAAQGQSAGDTSDFVLALKKPLFGAVGAKGGEGLAPALWLVSRTVDKLAQHTVTTFQEARENIIRRQQEELLELSTPVVKLWEGVLAVPMIGVLDSSRTQMVMEALLQKIVETGSELAIIDITGVPTVDTLVAQHLLKTVSAIRLMGADCIISGIRPQIAQTIVHLGIDLQGVSTKATLADALSLALLRTGWRVAKAA